MEKLKSAVPDSLRQMVAESTPNDLPSTSSALLDFFLNLEQFHNMLRDLVDPETALCGKNKDTALELKHKGNQCFVSGDNTQALTCYSQALRVAPINAMEMGKNLVATLYVNRASLFHKMGLLKESLRDCGRALQISLTYSKAWYRRGKVNFSLGNYEDAVHDLTIAKTVESSAGGKRQIESELNIFLHHHGSPSSKSVQTNHKNAGILDVPHQIKVKCVWTLDKGRGMASECDIPQASLIHSEEPYAVIILKHCRETHCHYCLNELPVDAVPCMSCSIPLYCSQQCQMQAGGQMCRNNLNDAYINENHFKDLEDYVAKIVVDNYSDLKVERIPEHKHECQGVHWPAILPSDVVLAGRILVKALEQNGHSMELSNLSQALDLSHCYSKLPPESKLELHIYSIVLLFCLQKSYCTELLINAVSISQIVLLLSQIRVNSIAIVRMNSSDEYGLQDRFQKVSSSEAALTSTMEQVRVGQAIYMAGSLFNHSCLPNIHAYFLSRTLLMRTTEHVVAGSPLEISYGPQVGQWDCRDRLKFLEDEYFFQCHCRGCSKLNAPDLVLNGFRCVDPNCTGVILHHHMVKCEKQNVKISTTSSVESLQLVDGLSDAVIKEVACLLVEEKNRPLHIDSGYCLNCGLYRDLESSSEAVNKALIHIRRLQDSIATQEISSTALSDALRSLGLLRSILHAYNKVIAEAEDSVAQAFCLVGDALLSMNHSEASIQILEKLYGPNHIAIGYELVKLSSIKLSLGDDTAMDIINQLVLIFLRYYGSHADMMFPYLQFLKREGRRICKQAC